MAEVVREAIASHLDAEPPALIQLPPAFDSGRSDTSARLDELLFAGVDPHGQPQPKHRRQ